MKGSFLFLKLLSIVNRQIYKFLPEFFLTFCQPSRPRGIVQIRLKSIVRPHLWHQTETGMLNEVPGIRKSNLERYWADLVKFKSISLRFLSRNSR